MEAIQHGEQKPRILSAAMYPPHEDMKMERRPPLPSSTGVFAMIWGRSSVTARRLRTNCGVDAMFRKSDDIIKSIETDARVVAQHEAGLRNFVRIFRLIAHDVQTFFQTVIAITEQQ